MPVARSLLSVPLAVCLIVVAPWLGGQASATTAANVSPTRASAQSDLLAAINAYRAANGRQALVVNASLAAAASWMASDMAAKNYMAHTSSDGRSPVQRMAAFGYPASSMYTGEDLAAGYASASAVIAAWQASAAHNSVMLNPSFDAIGIGLAYDGGTTYKWYWAADFGGSGGAIRAVAPAPAPPAPAVRAVAPARAAPAAAIAPSAEELAAGSSDEPAAAPASVPTREDRLWSRRIDHLFAVLMRMRWL